MNIARRIRSYVLSLINEPHRVSFATVLRRILQIPIAVFCLFKEELDRVFDRRVCRMRLHIFVERTCYVRHLLCSTI